MLERLAKKNADKVRIVKVDISEHQEWAVEQNVTGVPTFQIYGGGNKLEQFAGGYPENFIQRKIDYHAENLALSDGVIAVGGDSGPVRVIQPMPKDWLPPGVTPR